MKLETQNLWKRFGGVDAVADVNLVFDTDATTAIIGPNGAGKTTFFNLVTGYLPVDEGKVLLDGADITHASPPIRSNKGMGRSFQITSIFPLLSAYENVQVAMMSARKITRNLFRPARNVLRAEVMAVLEEVGLRAFAEETSANLSHGDRKRLELGIVLSLQPGMLLLDEPTAGMAPAEKARMMELVQEIAKARNLTLVFTEHDMDVVSEHADRVAVMHYGRLIALGTMAEIRANEQVQTIYLGGGRWFSKQQTSTPSTG